VVLEAALAANGRMQLPITCWDAAFFKRPGRYRDDALDGGEATFREVAGAGCRYGDTLLKLKGDPQRALASYREGLRNDPNNARYTPAGRGNELDRGIGGGSRERAVAISFSRCFRLEYAADWCINLP